VQDMQHPTDTRPLKVLFVGRGESSHTLSFIDMVRAPGFDVRLFSMATGAPPADWPVTTYVSCRPPVPGAAGAKRINLYPASSAGQAARLYLAGFGALGRDNIAGRWLARIIKKWRPDIIHSIGIRYAGYFVHHVRTTFGVAHIGRWLAQDWGPDLTMDRLLEEYRPRIQGVLENCDCYLSDNDFNYQVAESLGLDPRKRAPMGPVLASGGMDMQLMDRLAAGPPSQRERSILWPKAYNCPQSTAYPVFEAIQLCWERIAPCTIFMSAMVQEEVRLWFMALPESIRAHCRIAGRIARGEFLRTLGASRIMLAPTLSDGFPNTVAEAMALGALPVVSPLEAITAHIGDANALFARNCHPQEIADALVRGMEDDALADATASRNRQLVANLFERNTARQALLDCYAALANSSARRTS